jgi:NitrOD domain-containing protein
LSSLDESIIKKAIILATEKSLTRAGPHFKALLVFYLKDRHNVGLDVVYDDPRIFHESITDLFGIYSSRLLESLIEDIIRDRANTQTPDIDFKSFIERVKSGKINVAINSKNHLDK